MTTGYRPLFYSLLFLSLAFLFATQAHGMPVAKAETPITASAASHGNRTLQPRMIVEGMNNQGWIVGHWTDSKGEMHWFMMNPFMPIFSDVATHGAAHASGLTATPSGGLTLATDAGS
jgi:hypothetical protein